MADIRSWAKACSGPELNLDELVKRSLDLFISRLRSGTPRHVPCHVADHVVHVFTDGASEGDQHTIGGVIMVSFFGSAVPDSLVKKYLLLDSFATLFVTPLYIYIYTHISWFENPFTKMWMIDGCG